MALGEPYGMPEIALAIAHELYSLIHLLAHDFCLSKTLSSMRESVPRVPEIHVFPAEDVHGVGSVSEGPPPFPSPRRLASLIIH